MSLFIPMLIIISGQLKTLTTKVQLQASNMLEALQEESMLWEVPLSMVNIGTHIILVLFQVPLILVKFMVVVMINSIIRILAMGILMQRVLSIRIHPRI